MTLDEAIKIVDTNQAPPLMHPESRYNEALKLLIEAGKEALRHRRYKYSLPTPLLPGETED